MKFKNPLYNYSTNESPRSLAKSGLLSPLSARSSDKEKKQAKSNSPKRDTKQINFGSPIIRLKAEEGTLELIEDVSKESSVEQEPEPYNSP